MPLRVIADVAFGVAGILTWDHPFVSTLKLCRKFGCLMWPDEAYNQRPQLRWYEWFRQKVPSLIKDKHPLGVLGHQQRPDSMSLSGDSSGQFDTIHSRHLEVRQQEMDLRLERF